MKIIVFIFFVIFAAFTSFAQTSKKTEIKQCDPQTARLYVEQQAIDSKSIIESDKRINILIRVADYFWDKENDSARKYFAEAFKLAQERFKEKGIKNTSTTKFFVQKETDYRIAVIRAVSKRDAEWAKKMTDEVLKSFDKDENLANRDSFLKDQEISEALFLGVSLVETNPKAAISIFRGLMNYPVAGTWYYVLYQIASKNPSLAEQIYAELLVKYSNSGVRDFLYLSAFPFGNARILGLEKYRFGYTTPPVAVNNPNLQRQFISILLNQINSLTAETNKLSQNPKVSDAGYALSALNELTPIVNQNFPELKSSLVSASARAISLIDEESRKNMDAETNRKESEGKTFAEKIKELEESDAKGTLTDYQIVKLILEIKKDSELKALEPWLDKIKDVNVREKSVNFFYFTSSKISIKDKRFADARKFADKVPQIEHRAVLYFDMADEKLKEPLTRYESLEILSEVYKTAEKAPDTVEKAQVLLGVAFMFEKIDRFNSIDTLSKAIHTANKLENPELFSEFIAIKIVGESFGVFAGYSVPGFDINKTFYQISNKDFQGAISQAEGFSDKYLRTLAILASVKDCEKIEPNLILEK